MHKTQHTTPVGGRRTVSFAGVDVSLPQVTVSLPLIITAVTILILFQQSYTILRNGEENTLADIEIQIEIADGDSNLLTYGEQLEEEDEELQIINENKYIHSIVLEDDKLFQNNISVDWKSYQADGNMRRSLQNAPSEIG